MARVRRTFTLEFKRDAVRLVVTGGKTVPFLNAGSAYFFP
jgi:transposase-like protein